MPLLDKALENFPRSEVWRLQTDGCQATQGPNNFRPQFYNGMQAGFDFINRNSDAELTPELIEGIYQSAYQYESDFSTDEVFRKGFSEGYGAFEIFFPLEGLEGQAGITEAGLDELLEALTVAYQKKGSRIYPQYGIVIDIDGVPFPINFDPTGFDSADEAKDALRTHLLNASHSKDAYKGDKNGVVLTKVELTSYKASRKEILAWVQADIDKYGAELAKAKEITSPQQRKQAEIIAINNFVRKLHQCHYFPDGNGRTFVFLLANMLLLQNGHGMKITENPAHYAAYSSQELLQETLHDLDHFNEYKITNAKNYLVGLTANDTVLNQRDQVKATLITHLSQDPLIAMAQIDELYHQIRDNDLVVPQGYFPDPTGFSAYIFYKAAPEIKDGRLRVLNILKEAYVDKLEQLVQNVPEVEEEQRIGYGSKAETPGNVLQAMIDRQTISVDVPHNAVSALVQGYEEAVTAREEHVERVNDIT
ncbi:Phosphocholine transferase AnkX [Legionella massiliensis]|uniref:Phosphocholine transferase AnkX n=1 Tax=Legionella massiliensis TaxID=1034943 RepID=A0A078KZ52_9GAMM|nr:hypothetical protein [Legionella massiliensis]CDZ78216.1 Phosphocholine transferase AnkX [Legionella massiliensis]CEE13954.1 Phosphocholine transferase AnkX [Legionella massiliensis]